MMASCEEFELLISLGLDGELSPEEALQLQDHLKSCPACCQFNQELSEIQSSISSLLLSPRPHCTRVLWIKSAKRLPFPLKTLQRSCVLGPFTAVMQPPLQPFSCWYPPWCLDQNYSLRI